MQPVSGLRFCGVGQAAGGEVSGVRVELFDREVVEGGAGGAMSQRGVQVQAGIAAGGADGVRGRIPPQSAAGQKRTSATGDSYISPLAAIGPGIGAISIFLARQKIKTITQFGPLPEIRVWLFDWHHTPVRGDLNHGRYLRGRALAVRRATYVRGHDRPFDLFRPGAMGPDDWQLLF